MINRVSLADINFNKEMELAPRVSPEFELTLDNTPCIHTIENMNFFQMKGEFSGNGCRMAIIGLVRTAGN